MNEPSIADWHSQFLRQAKWTQMTRSQLYRRANLIQAESVLDVGCGTGVITNELARRTRGRVVGLDIDPQMLAQARRLTSRVRYREGDAQELPFPDESFDVVTCHFVLMWMADPAEAVREMARVVRSDGAVLICAEPDYGGRLDWPDLPIREWQVDGLQRQGADPCMGRQLRSLVTLAGLRVEVGAIPFHWDARALLDHFDSEWEWVQRDVGDQVPSSVFAEVKERAKHAIHDGTRLVYIPVFYALGKK